jgi:UDP-N-acetyl-D-mannosaminuronic acid transferase (WecB/TagA/CpsF family)
LYGITFIAGNYSDLREHLAQRSGVRLVVVPSAPVLSEIHRDPNTHEALKAADIAIPDSSFMLLLLRLFQRISLPKYSGFKLVGDLLSDPDFLSSKLLLVDPSQEASQTNVTHLMSLGMEQSNLISYVAPWYGKTGPLTDPSLNSLIAAERPDNIMINLGGMTQERLGAGIKQSVDTNCRIFCTGAAIAFYNGQQAPISILIDKLHLGWLWRCLYKPTVFIPRYLRAFRLGPLLFRLR